MSRSARLLRLMDALRRRRRPVAAAVLAAELRVSLRTIYRDIETLKGEGAAIEGEAGLGFVLRQGFFLPPLSFSDDELDAVILGLRFVLRRGDDELAGAAENALAKIEAVLPVGRENARALSPLLAGPRAAGERAHLGLIRRAIRAEKKLSLDYNDRKRRASQRVVWPIAVGFFDAGEMLAAWCETRGDFRHFRLDRIAAVASVPEKMPKRHRILLAEWRLSQRFEEP